MAGKKGMKCRKRSTLPARFKPGWLKKGDGRKELYRSLHARLAAYTDQYGGPEALSPVQLVLVERLVFLEAQVQTYEKDVIAGKPIEHGEYLAYIYAFHTLAKSLGLGRAAKRVLSLAERVGE